MSDTPGTDDLPSRLRKNAQYDFASDLADDLNDAADEIERLNGVISDDSNKIAGMQEVINAFKRERDAALALLCEAQEVLSRNWFVDSDGESYNNDAVIAMDDKITKFLEPK